MTMQANLALDPAAAGSHGNALPAHGNAAGMQAGVGVGPVGVGVGVGTQRGARMGVPPGYFAAAQTPDITMYQHQMAAQAAMMAAAAQQNAMPPPWAAGHVNVNAMPYHATLVAAAAAAATSQNATNTTATTATANDTAASKTEEMKALEKRVAEAEERADAAEKSLAKKAERLKHAEKRLKAVEKERNDKNAEVTRLHLQLKGAVDGLKKKAEELKKCRVQVAELQEGQQETPPSTTKPTEEPESVAKTTTTTTAAAMPAPAIARALSVPVPLRQPLVEETTSGRDIANMDCDASAMLDSSFGSLRLKREELDAMLGRSIGSTAPLARPTTAQAAPNPSAEVEETTSAPTGEVSSTQQYEPTPCFDPAALLPFTFDESPNNSAAVKPTPSVSAWFTSAIAGETSSPPPHRAEAHVDNLAVSIRREAAAAAERANHHTTATARNRKDVVKHHEAAMASLARLNEELGRVRMPWWWVDDADAVAGLMLESPASAASALGAAMNEYENWRAVDWLPWLAPLVQHTDACLSAFAQAIAAETSALRNAGPRLIRGMLVAGNVLAGGQALRQRLQCEVADCATALRRFDGVVWAPTTEAAEASSTPTDEAAKKLALDAEEALIRARAELKLLTLRGFPDHVVSKATAVVETLEKRFKALEKSAGMKSS